MKWILGTMWLICFDVAIRVADLFGLACVQAIELPVCANAGCTWRILVLECHLLDRNSKTRQYPLTRWATNNKLKNIQSPLSGRFDAVSHKSISQINSCGRRTQSLSRLLSWLKIQPRTLYSRETWINCLNTNHSPGCLLTSSAQEKYIERGRVLWGAYNLMASNDLMVSRFITNVRNVVLVYKYFGTSSGLASLKLCRVHHWASKLEASSIHNTNNW